jgi:coenzyme F420 hydrogenase subunit beta
MTVCDRNFEIKELFETVVDGGYCIGCGACAAANGSPVEMNLDEYERFQATLVPGTNRSSPSISLESVCPFSAKSLDEDRIGEELFGRDCSYRDRVGYYLANYAGYVSEGNFRDGGSSGGLGTWIAAKLIKENLVDGIIHIHPHQPTAEDSRLFKYQLSLSVEDVQKGAKSRYYPVEMSEAIEIIRHRPGRYAFVGIPCFIKAVRLLMRRDPLINERIKFCIGLVCGHLKSAAFAKLLAWQCGIEPDKILAFDFRKKLPDADANKYGIEVTGIKDGQIVTINSPVRDLYGADWGLGFFKYKACDYCDDVLAETADLSIGDAWLPQYLKDSRGTNVAVVRHPQIQKLLEQAIDAGDLKLDRIDPDEVAKSQRSGFRHRREGLAYRLYLADKKRQWRPPKRVKPQAKHLDRSERQRFSLRILLAEQSHSAFKNATAGGQLSVFQERMVPLVQEYELASLSPRPPLWQRIRSRLKKYYIQLFG